MLEKGEAENTEAATTETMETMHHDVSHDNLDLVTSSPLPILLTPVASMDHGTRSLSRHSSMKSNASLTNGVFSKRSSSLAPESTSLSKRNSSIRPDGLLSKPDFNKGKGSGSTDDLSHVDQPSEAELRMLKRADTHILDDNSSTQDCSDIRASLPDIAKDDSHVIAEDHVVDAMSCYGTNGDINDSSAKETPLILGHGSNTDHSSTSAVKGSASNPSSPHDEESNDDVEDDDDMDTSDSVQASSGPGPIEVVISFDTTGSMSNCLDEVKNRINDVINRLFMDIPSLKIGVIAHGDYCDETVYYLTQAIDLTNDVGALCAFVRDVEGTGGGDFAECYELILRNSRLIKWTPGSKRALIMIGDACPHTPEELKQQGREVINWVHEATKLSTEQNVKVYGVQCLNHPEAGTFWRDIAVLSGGEHLKLDTLDSIVDIIMAICYRERGSHFLDAYEKEVREREGRLLASELDAAFGALRSASDPSAIASGPSTAAAPKIKHGAGASKKVKTSASKQKTKKASADATSCKDNGGVAANTTVTHKQLFKTKARVTSKRNRNASVNRKKIPVVYRQSREKVIEANFALNHLAWSKWEAIMTAQHRDGPNWRLGPFCYIKRLPSFKESSRRAAVYELAVQPGPRCKRYVTYGRVTQGVQPKNWMRELFRKVFPCIEAVLKQSSDAQIFVRRAFIGNKTQIRGVTISTPRRVNVALQKMYSYAWNEHMKNNTAFPCEKRLCRNGINIC